MQQTEQVKVERTTATTPQRVVNQEVASVQRGYQGKKVIFRAYQIIWYILGIIETLLVFRFLLKLLGANVGSAFVRFIYSASGGLVRPFVGIFRTGAVEGSVFEWTTLVAMAVYAVIAYGLVYFFQLIKPVEKEEVESAVDNP
jgi:hypothetical protein